MKFTYSFALALATLGTISIAAQQPDTPQPQQPATPQPQQQQPDTQAAPPAKAAAAMPLSPITGELAGKLDSKTAKAGDSVVLKTTANATMPDGIVIPKGSKIVGHVTEAQPHGEDANGRVTLQFDQAQLKSGQSLPIMSAIQSVAPAGEGADNGGGGMPMGGASPAPSSGGSSAGGGSGTGSSGGSNSASRTAPAQSAPSPGMASSGGGAQAGPPPGTAVAQNGNVVIRTTSVPGVLVACSASGRPFSNASGALMSAKQDVHLDGGTKVMLAIASTSGPGNSR